MQRSDFIPLALVVALAGVVGFGAVRQPRRMQKPVSRAPLAAPVKAVAAAASEARTVVIADSAPATQSMPEIVEVVGFVRTPVSDEINRRLRYGAATTFILEALEGDSNITRWPDRPTEAIRVWVEPSPSIPDWDPAFLRAARDGIKRWNSAGIPVRMNFVVDSTDAEVKLRWVSKMDGRTVGQTMRFRNREFWLVRAEIIMAIHEPGGAVLSPASIRSIATHEAGHMLGLDHSPYQLDIMAPGYSQQIEPSVSDLNTMRLLYTLPPGRFR
jgi:hypothetical protein